MLPLPGVSLLLPWFLQLLQVTLRAEDERGRGPLSFWVWVTSLSVVEVTKGRTSSGRGEIGKGHSAPITQEEQEGFYSENLFRTRENRANKNQTAKDH